MSKAGKKGDLEVTVLEGRNLVPDNKPGHTYCSLDLPGNKTIFSQTAKDDTPRWNSTLTFDLKALDGEELLIQVFSKRTIRGDKFLGQVQIPIKALSLSKEAEWYYLTDKPQNTPEMLQSPDIKADKKTRRGSKDQPPGSGTLTKKMKGIIITGEIRVKLNFVHRLLRAKSRALLSESPKADRAVPLGNLPPTKPLAQSEERPKLSVSNSLRNMKASVEVPVPEDLAKRESVSLDPVAMTPSQNEEIMIEEALKQKKAMVRQKLDQKRELLRFLTTRISLISKTKGEDAVTEEKKQLAELQLELKALESVLETEEQDTSVAASTASSTTHASGAGEVRSPSLAARGPVSRAESKRVMRERKMSIGPEMLDRKMTMTVTDNSVPNRRSQRFDPSELSKLTDSQKAVLEVELNNERKLSQVLVSKNELLEKSVKRLEEEVERLKDLKPVAITDENLRARELRLLEMEENILLERKRLEVARDKFDEDVNATREIYERIHKEAVAQGADQLQAIADKRSDVEQRLKDVEESISQVKVQQAKIDAELLGRKLKKREAVLSREQRSLKRKEDRLNNNDDTEEFSDEESEEELEDDDLSEISQQSERSHKRHPHTEDSGTDKKLDLLVGKLEKLDKLDELLRKIENMKVVSGGMGMGAGDGGNSSGRTYDDIKAELSELEKIIFDETDKYTEKEKEDANIKYEKAFGDLQQTAEFKAEIIRAADEKRKANEPLNKAALEKMVKIYNPETIKADSEIKEKVQKNPELALIGMDPKAILSKHQNDFGQYLLRNLELDELRAIRASLPKFRNDQKRQQDWMDGLENKIEQVMKDPPKPKAPKAVTLPKWKPKPVAPAGDGQPVDMFAEILKKAKKIGDDEPAAPTEEKEKLPAPSKLGSKLVPAASQDDDFVAVKPPPPPPKGLKPPPPPPPKPQ